MAIVGALVAAVAGLTAPMASADVRAAYFTLQEADWHPGTTHSLIVDQHDSLELRFQTDGNLVLYHVAWGVASALWASGSDGIGITDLDWSQARFHPPGSAVKARPHDR